MNTGCANKIKALTIVVGLALGALAQTANAAGPEMFSDAWWGDFKKVQKACKAVGSKSSHPHCALAKKYRELSSAKIRADQLASEQFDPAIDAGMALEVAKASVPAILTMFAGPMGAIAMGVFQGGVAVVETTGVLEPASVQPARTPAEEIRARSTLR